MCVCVCVCVCVCDIVKITLDPVRPNSGAKGMMQKDGGRTLIRGNTEGYQAAERRGERYLQVNLESELRHWTEQREQASHELHAWKNKLAQLDRYPPKCSTSPCCNKTQ